MGTAQSQSDLLQAEHGVLGYKPVLTVNSTTISDNNDERMSASLGHTKACFENNMLHTHQESGTSLAHADRVVTPVLTWLEVAELAVVVVTFRNAMARRAQVPPYFWQWPMVASAI